jgi:hypothetical protein
MMQIAARPPRIDCTATLDNGSSPLGFKVTVGVAVGGKVAEKAMDVLLVIGKEVRVVMAGMLSLGPAEGKTLSLTGYWSACRLMILGKESCFREPG